MAEEVVAERSDSLAGTRLDTQGYSMQAQLLNAVNEQGSELHTALIQLYERAQDCVPKKVAELERCMQDLCKGVTDEVAAIAREREVTQTSLRKLESRVTELSKRAEADQATQRLIRDLDSRVTELSQPSASEQVTSRRLKDLEGRIVDLSQRQALEQAPPADQSMPPAVASEVQALKLAVGQLSVQMAVEREERRKETAAAHQKVEESRAVAEESASKASQLEESLAN